MSDRRFLLAFHPGREEAFDRMVQMDFSNDRTGSENGVNTIEPPVDEAHGE